MDDSLPSKDTASSPLTKIDKKITHRHIDKSVKYMWWNGWKLLITFAKSFIIDFGEGHKYVWHTEIFGEGHKYVWHT